MKSFRKIIWTIVAIQFVFTTICFAFFAPETVITHFGFKGIDSVGPRYMLFLEPICTVVSGLLIIWVAKVRRRENGIKENVEVIYGPATADIKTRLEEFLKANKNTNNENINNVN